MSCQIERGQFPECPHCGFDGHTEAAAVAMRDKEWREWWDRVAMAAGLRQSWFEQHLPAPDTGGKW